MPTAALRPCRVCSVVGCTAHPPRPRDDWDHARPRPRLGARARTRARDELFAKEPFCQICRRRLARIRDHIRPLAEGGTEDPSNIQGLCKFCHKLKSRAEAARGRARAERMR